MCGRTACTLAPDDIVKACTYKDDRGQKKRPVWKDALSGHKYWQSCNIAPTSHTPVLVQSGFDGTEQESASDRIVIPMKWGLTPSWHIGDPYKVSYETNNCRSEGMLERKTYKVPLQKGFRCVVLADGYFEWKTTPEGKQPYFFYFPQPKDIAYPGETVKTELMSSVKEQRTIDLEKQDVKKTQDDEQHNVLKQEGLSEKWKQEDFSVQVKQETDTDLQNHDPKEEILSAKSSEHSPKDHAKTENSSRETADTAQINSQSQGDDTNGDVAEWTGQRLLTMAGLYDVWTPPDGSPPIYSYSIITLPASADIEWCHRRMPAILSTEEDVRDWLDSANVKLKKATSIIKQHTGLAFHPVSKAMNNSRYKSPDCLKPVELGKPKERPSNNMIINWLKSGSPAKKRKGE